MNSYDREIKAYILLVATIICGLAVATVTANKIVHICVNFPFSNLVFSFLTYPLIDCICEVWGKKIANQTIYLALLCQAFIAFLLHLSIITPAADFWPYQYEYQTIIASSGKVFLASFIAFGVSQFLDVAIYQKIKVKTKGKFLWFRTNLSTILGQAIDSAIFISIVFFYSQNKIDIFLGSITVKIVISILMTPVVYYIVHLCSSSHHGIPKTLFRNKIL